jgi:hypothetical protein
MMRTIGAYNITGTEAAPTLERHNFAQEFVSPLDNLHKVEVMFDVPATTHPQPLLVTIINPETGEQLRQVSAIAEVGAKNSFIEFEFEPIPDSQDTKYQLVIGPEISSDESTDESGEDTSVFVDQPVQLKFTSDNYYQQGELYIDGEASGGDLVFRTFHQVESYPSFVLGTFFSKIQADPIFIVLWLALLISTGIAVLAGLTLAFTKK